MKKIILSLSLFLFLACSVQAQFGLRAGLNLANQSQSPEDPDFSTTNSLGFHFGLTYEKMINETLNFKPGILFSMKGSKIDGFDAKLKFNYIEIPLDFVYSTGALNINAGPYLGYALSAKGEYLGVSEDIEFEKGGPKRIDFGLNLGLSYGINEMLSVGAQYGLGLSNISDNEEGDDSSVKNKVIAFYVGYAF